MSNSTLVDFAANFSKINQSDQQQEQQQFLVSLSNVIASIELPPLALLLAVSAINTWLILKSSVLHANLKAILLGQSLVIFVYAMLRLLGRGQFTRQLLRSIIENNALKQLEKTCLTFGNIIGHLLIVERAMATLNSRNYENQKNRWFTFGWIFSMISLAVFNQINPTFASFGSSVSFSLLVVLSHLALVFSGLEIIAFAWLNFHNRKRFNTFSNIRANLTHRYQLSERYQLLQNIHSGRQLAPTFLFHLFSILCSNIASSINAYWPVQPVTYTFVINCIFVVHAFSKLAIEITVITFHPLLYRRLRNTFFVCCSPKSTATVACETEVVGERVVAAGATAAAEGAIGPSTSAEAVCDNNNDNGNQPQEQQAQGEGEQLPQEQLSNADQHFLVLQRFWQ